MSIIDLTVSGATHARMTMKMITMMATTTTTTSILKTTTATTTTKEEGEEIDREM